MSEVFFISDLHIGHKNIHKFRVFPKEFSCEEDHREYIKKCWNDTISKRDVVWVLGDVIFKEELIPFLDQLKGSKRLILGNHDLEARHYIGHADFVGGMARYKGFWLTHCPIHPQELRGHFNIHGHVHGQTLYDRRYFNACPENHGYSPISFDTIKATMEKLNA